MHHDPDSRYRRLLAAEVGVFADRVDDPWQIVPDYPPFNARAFYIVQRKIQELKALQAANRRPQSQGVLVLGAAGAGKTHLLMRLAQRLSRVNHVMFIRKPNNVDAVALHVWSKMIDSLTHPLDGVNNGRTQLDNLLLNVISRVVVEDIDVRLATGVKNDALRPWRERIQADPFEILNPKIIGKGDARQSKVRAVRNKTAQYVARHHPEADQQIVHALVTYCFTQEDRLKRALLMWLRGQPVDEGAAVNLGLADSWLTTAEAVSSEGIRLQREELAYRAMQTIGILSQHYEPLILAFDQVECMRDEPLLTRRWSDAMREILTMVPNLVVIVCTFPDLWDTWFTTQIDTAALDRISQTRVELDGFTPELGTHLLATHLQAVNQKHRLPTPIYPFTTGDVAQILKTASRPRAFLQQARDCMDDWLMEEANLPREEQAPVSLVADSAEPEIQVEDEVLFTTPAAEPSLAVETVHVAPPPAATARELDPEIRKLEHRARVRRTVNDRIDAMRRDLLRNKNSTPVPEEELLGVIWGLLRKLLESTGHALPEKSLTSKKSLPSNRLIVAPDGAAVCLAVCSGKRAGPTAKLNHLIDALAGELQPTRVVLLRDVRHGSLNASVQKRLKTLAAERGAYVEVDVNEWALLEALAQTLTAIEQRDIAVDDEILEPPALFVALRASGILWQSQVLRNLVAEGPWMVNAIGDHAPPNRSEDFLTELVQSTLHQRQRADNPLNRNACPLQILSEPKITLRHFQVTVHPIPGVLDRHLGARTQAPLFRLGDAIFPGSPRAGDDGIRVSFAADELGRRKIDLRNDLTGPTRLCLVLDEADALERISDFLDFRRRSSNHILAYMLQNGHGPAATNKVEAQPVTSADRPVTYLVQPDALRRKEMAAVVTSLLADGRRILLTAGTVAGLTDATAAVLSNLTETAEPVQVAVVPKGIIDATNLVESPSRGFVSVEPKEAGGARLVISSLFELSEQVTEIGLFDYVIVHDAPAASIPALVVATFYAEMGVIFIGDPAQAPTGCGQEWCDPPAEFFRQNIFEWAGVPKERTELARLPV